MGIISNQILINRGNETSNFTLDVSGTMRITSLSGNGSLVITDSSGVLSTTTPIDSSGYNYPGYFGDGHDGDVSISGSVTLTKEMNYNNLHVLNGGEVKTVGYIIRVRNKLTIDFGGTISCNGFDGILIQSEGGPGAYSSMRYPEFGVPGKGGNGGQSGGSSLIIHDGALGGTGIIKETGQHNVAVMQYSAGAGGGGGGCLGFIAVSPTVGESTWINWSVGRKGKTSYANGVSESLWGGGGGGGGGVLCIYAYNPTGSGMISAVGGNGGDGDAGSGSGGGGGGGGGGTILLYNRTGSWSGFTKCTSQGLMGYGGSATDSSGQNGYIWTNGILIG